MTTWFTSDWHLSHNNIIKYCDRPFQNIEDMNYHIIGKYLRVVQPEDTVFFLGDLTIKRHTSFKPVLAEIVRDLPGQKHFIRGNHDYYPKNFYLNDCGFLSFGKKITTSKYVIVHDPADFNTNDLLSAKILIHGHQHHHQKTRIRGKKFDIGVDGNNFYPVKLTDILETYKALLSLNLKH